MFIASLLFIALFTVSLAHFVWSIGRTSPIRNEKLLAQTVVGFRDVERMPPRLASLAIALATAAAAIYALALADHDSGGALLNLGGDERLGLTTRHYLPDRRYELHVKFTYPDLRAARLGFSQVMWGEAKDGRGWTLYLNTSPTYASVRAPDGAVRPVPFPLQEVNAVDLVYFDATSKLTINGVDVDLSFADAKVIQSLPKENSVSFTSSVPIRLTELRFQHLAAKP